MGSGKSATDNQYIFILQAEKYRWTDAPADPRWDDYSAGNDRYCVWKCNGQEVSMDHMVKRGMAVPYWEFVRAFSSLEELRRYSPRNEELSFLSPLGYRSYRIPAGGALAELLRARSAKPTGDLEN